MTVGVDPAHDRRHGAFHEAGHAVAALFLGLGLRTVSIVEDDDSYGRFDLGRRSATLIAKLEEAEHDASFGRDIAASLRRRVEHEIMVGFAGGLSEMRATGKNEHEVGTGTVAVDMEAANGLPIHSLIVGGDAKMVLTLAEAVSGGDDEASAYLDWLRERTLSLMRQPDFWPSVEVVAEALLERERLNGREVRGIVRGATETRWEEATASWRRRLDL